MDQENFAVAPDYGCRLRDVRQFSFIVQFLLWYLNNDDTVQQRFCIGASAYRSLMAFTRRSAIAEGPRDALCQLKSCQLPRNSAETICMTSPDQIDGMKLEV